LEEKIGKIHEELYFGKCPLKCNGEYMQWWECVGKIVKKGEPEKNKFTRYLCEKISFTAKTKNVSFFSSINSPLDLYHGIDGFIIIWKNWKHINGRITTLDITLRESKPEFKSDFLVTPKDLLNINLLVKEITDSLEKRPLFYSN